MDDLDGLGDKELIQSALRGDFELITGYGEEHPGPGRERGSATSPTIMICSVEAASAAPQSPV